MKKIFLLFLTIITVSCSRVDVEPIVLTEESFSVKLDSTGFFGSNNIQAQINQNFTFLKIESRLRDVVFRLKIGSEEEGAPILTEGVYSINEDGELVANIEYINGAQESSTEAGFFRQIEITSIDIDSGIVYGRFSGILSSSGNNIYLNEGQFTGVFFSVEQ